MEDLFVINIISTCANATRITGPQKVFANLVKGLDRLGYPYVINRDLFATNRLWIHDDVNALKYMHRSKAHKVVGPNLFVMPSDIPKDIHFNGTLYLHPSKWAVEVWKQAGFDACPMAPWPVGIDTDEFLPSTVPHEAKRIMVYHKKRDKRELDYILELLNQHHFPYSLVVYGKYEESEYRAQLANTSFIIWHGRHESQGIALQEAMSYNIPILVCDVTSLAQEIGGNFDRQFHHVPVTAAPYFDETCGIKITDLEDLKTAIFLMINNFYTFSPREYVLKYLSLEKQAKTFIDFWKTWDLGYENGFQESIKAKGTWKVPRYAEYWRKMKSKISNMIFRN